MKASTTIIAASTGSIGAALDRENAAEIDDLFSTWLRLCVEALVATTLCRVIFERTKKTSRIGPEIPAVSASAEQMKPHADD
jgi:hypothetical protein